MYIDAGSSTWVARQDRRTISVAPACSTPAASRSTQPTSTAPRRSSVGNALARSLGKHFVVNTAENANGSLPKRKWGQYGSAATTCNPRNAGLGTRPTTATGSSYADAFLWISRPGLSSNGKAGNPQCGRKGGPSGNVFWVKHAVRLARQSKPVQAASWPPPAL